MKHLLLALLLVSFSSSLARADSPDAILKDYRKQAAQAVERLNQSLEKAATPLITKLVSSGDTAGAEELTAQLKAKVAGEPVPKPQASATQLFSMYDDARAKALAPVQKSSIARIDSLLKTAGGAKLETVTELGKAKEEIEAGKLSAPIFAKWTYHQTLDSAPIAEMELKADGTWTLFVIAKSVKEVGKWTTTSKGNVLSLSYGGSTWDLTLDGRKASMNRPDSGMRYLKAVGAAKL